MSHTLPRIATARAIAGLLVLLWSGPAFAQSGDGAAADPAADAAAMLEGLLAEAWSVASSDAKGPHKRDALEGLLAEHLDSAALAQGALGARAEQFGREAYAAFAHEYARYVTWLFVQRIADAERPAELLETKLLNEGVAQARALGRDRRRVFRFERNAPEGRSELHIVLHRSDGAWRVAGLRIDAVDVTESFRQQFDAVLQRSEPSELIAELRRRNRENEDVDPFA